MKEYTAKEMKQLKANPYTFKVTKSRLYFTAEFKEAFWTAYQAGMAPRKILEDFGGHTERDACRIKRSSGRHTE